MRHLLFVIGCLLTVSPVLAQTGSVLDDLSLQSTILDSERMYAVYLPPDYDASARSYPVLYLLHGAGDDHTGWVQFGEVAHIADTAIRDGSATPMIIVMPDAQTGQRGYFNSIDGSWRYEDFFFEEFIPHVESTFRIRATKEFRAVSGLSMGGGGSLIYAMHRPDMFSASAPLSAYVGPLTESDMRRMMAAETANLDDEAIAAYFDRHQALRLAESVSAEDLNTVRWYIDCGDDDFLFEGNSLLHIALTKRQVRHEYRVRDGGHSWTYWRTSLPDVLAFVTQGFHR
ncbi:MAG: esterase family protein [Rhodothermales bacterium]|nr:esterase family protein [Rhodothermales bacterium]